MKGDTPDPWRKSMRRIIICCLAVPATLIGLALIEDIHRHRDFAYRPAEYDCGSGVLKASLMGARVRRGRDEIYAAPYTILVSFHCRDREGMVTLQGAQLCVADQPDRVCAKMEECTERLERCSEGDYASYFCLKDLDLEYIPYVVSIQMVVKKGQKTESKEVELPLAPDYRECWSLSFMEL